MNKTSIKRSLSDDETSDTECPTTSKKARTLKTKAPKPPKVKTEKVKKEFSDKFKPTWTKNQDTFVHQLVSDGNGGKKASITWEDVKAQFDVEFPNVEKAKDTIRMHWNRVLVHGDIQLNHKEVHQEFFLQSVAAFNKQDKMEVIKNHFNGLNKDARQLTKATVAKIYGDLKNDKFVEVAAEGSGIDPFDMYGVE